MDMSTKALIISVSVFYLNLLRVVESDRRSYLLPLLDGYSCHSQTQPYVVLQGLDRRSCLMRCMSDPKCIAINYRKNHTECALATDALSK